MKTVKLAEDATGGNTLFEAGSAYIFEASSTSSIIENDFGSSLVLYPNPTQGSFSIDLGETYSNVTVTISDILGKQIQNQAFNQTQQLNLTLNEPSGVYFVTATKKAVIRLVKE